MEQKKKKERRVRVKVNLFAVSRTVNNQTGSFPNQTEGFQLPFLFSIELSAATRSSDLSESMN